MRPDFFDTHMNIGDKVRLLHGRESGVITKLISAVLVEVEIEDGFKIPVQRNELAVVSDEEAKRFKPETLGNQGIAARNSAAPTILANNGVFMAFVATNDREMTLHLINNTDWDVPFSLYNGSEPHFKGLRSGLLTPKSVLKVQDLLVKDFEDWGTFTFQGLYYRPAFIFERQPLVRKVKFRANTFFKNKQKIPVLGKEGHLFQLDDEKVNIKPEELAEKMTTPTPQPLATPAKPAAVIDLHIEKLTKDFLAMSNAEMLQLQLNAFERQLENAIANGMGDITFIHGVGNGTLRDEIHRRASRHLQVKYFEDAQKEKFGYGATKLKLK